jgi:hypothetical protein
MRFLWAGAVALFDVFAGAAMFSGSPNALPWPKTIVVGATAFAVIAGGVLLGECFAVSRGYPSPFGAPPEKWLKTHFVLAGALMLAGVLFAGLAGRRVLIPIASAAFLMLLSDGILQRTDVLEGLSLALARGSTVLAGALIYPETIYRFSHLSFFKLPALVTAAVFMAALLGKALEPEPREARVAALLAAAGILSLIGVAAWHERSSLWTLIVWAAVFIVALEQLMVVWPAGIGKRRSIVRNLTLVLPLGIEAALITGLGGAWTVGGILTALLAAAFFFAVTLELEVARTGSTVFRRRL